MQVNVILMDETATSRVVIYCGKHHMTDQGETSSYETMSDPVRITASRAMAKLYHQGG